MGGAYGLPYFTDTASDPEYERQRRLSGSVTSPPERLDQGTVNQALTMIPPKESANGNLNPLSLLGGLIQLPFRALALADRGIKTGLGLPTMGDAAQEAARFLAYGQTAGPGGTPWQGFDQLPPDVQQEMRTRLAPKTAGAFGQDALDFLTGAQFDQERALVNAASQARARRLEFLRQSQLGHQQAAESEAQTQAAWEPTDRARKDYLDWLTGQARSFDVEHQQDEYNLNRQYKLAAIAAMQNRGGGGGGAAYDPIRAIQQRRMLLESAGKGPPGPINPLLEQQRFESLAALAEKRTKGMTDPAQIEAVYRSMGLPTTMGPAPETLLSPLWDLFGWRSERPTADYQTYQGLQQAEHEKAAADYLDELDPLRWLHERPPMVGVPTARAVPSVADIIEQAPKTRDLSGVDPFQAGLGLLRGRTRRSSDPRHSDNAITTTPGETVQTILDDYNTGIIDKQTANTRLAPFGQAIP